MRVFDLPFFKVVSSLFHSNTTHQRSTTAIAIPIQMAEFHPDSIRNDTNIKTMSRSLMLHTKDSELVLLISSIQTACKLIARSVRKAGIAGLCNFFKNLSQKWMRNYLFSDGTAGSENSTGDTQKKLDVLSNEMFINSLINSNVCAILVSEENEEPIIVEEKHAGMDSAPFSSKHFKIEFQGPFAVAFDPLDGSSNIDCNVSTGTIFSVWKKARYHNL